MAIFLLSTYLLLKEVIHVGRNINLYLCVITNKMEAPKLPSLFKTPRHKKFEFKPRYYDEAKERINERREQLKKEGLDNNDDKIGLIKYRINQKFQREQYRQSIKQANYRILIVIVIILLVLYYIFK